MFSLAHLTGASCGQERQPQWSWAQEPTLLEPAVAKSANLTRAASRLCAPTIGRLQGVSLGPRSPPCLLAKAVP